MGKKSIAVGKPSLSVICVVHDDSAHLAAFITNLSRAVAAAENVNGEINVVFVENGSRDRSAAIVSQHLALFGKGRLVRLPWPCGMRTAVAAGISEATGERLLVLSPHQAVDAAYLLGVSALLDTADAVLSGPPNVGPVGGAAGEGRRKCPEFVAFRASVAEDLILCCRPAGLADDLGTRMVSDAMSLRIAHLPLPQVGESLNEPAAAPRRRTRRYRRRLGHLLRAYRRRSRLAGSGEPARVRLQSLSEEEAVVVRQSASAPLETVAGAAEPGTIDLTGGGESALSALSAPSEQPGAVM